MVSFVWSDACLRHEPGAEVWVGTRTPATEVPERALAIREALLEVGAPEVPAVAHDDSALLAVHDPALVEFLRTAWDDWRRLHSRPTAWCRTSSRDPSSRVDACRPLRPLSGRGRDSSRTTR